VTGKADRRQRSAAGDEEFDSLLASSSLGSEQALEIRRQAPGSAREHARSILEAKARHTPPSWHSPRSPQPRHGAGQLKQQPHSARSRPRAQVTLATKTLAKTTLPSDGPGALLTLRSAIILGTALLVGLAAGTLTWLTTDSLPSAVLAVGPASAGTASLLNAIIG
jgi:hypothetical protein